MSKSFTIYLIAVDLYEDEIAKKMGINLHSEYGMKQMQEYRKGVRSDDELRARLSLETKYPNKYIDYSEIRNEADKINEERMKPYIEKAKVIYENQKQQEEKQEQGGPVKKLTRPKIYFIE